MLLHERKSQPYGETTRRSEAAYQHALLHEDTPHETNAVSYTHLDVYKRQVRR